MTPETFSALVVLAVATLFTPGPNNAMLAGSGTGGVGVGIQLVLPPLVLGLTGSDQVPLAWMLPPVELTHWTRTALWSSKFGAGEARAIPHNAMDRAIAAIILIRSPSYLVASLLPLAAAPLRER